MLQQNSTANSTIKLHYEVLGGPDDICVCLCLRAFALVSFAFANTPFYYTPFCGTLIQVLKCRFRTLYLT